MKRLSTAIVIVLLLTVVAYSQQSNSQLDKLFASAQHKAAVEGNIKGAIEDYERIVTAAGKDRGTAAKALLRIAEAYRDLSDRDAEQKVYRRIQREFADQKQAAQIAAANLRSESPSTIVWERAKADVYGGLWSNARVSRDGRLLAVPDFTTGNLLLHDLVTNTDRLLTRDGDIRRNAYAQRAAFSPDGRQIAFSFLDNVKRRYDVRLVPAAADRAPQIIFDQEDVKWVQPYDWSSDGRQIALQIERIDGTGQIALLNVTDQTTRV